MRTRRLASLMARVAVVCALLASLVVLTLHTAPVRRAVLRRTIATLADRFDLVLAASSLHYNVLTLRVTLRDVSVAAAAAPDSPFFSADAIDISVPRSALTGRFAIDRIHADRATLDIRRTADGRTNLPPPGEPGFGEPAALPLGRLDMSQLALNIVDETQGMSLLLPAMQVDIRRTSGDVRLERPGRFARGDVATSISELGGGVAFDGRAVELTQFDVVTPDARVTVDGTLAVLVREPSVSIRFSGSGDVQRVARWVVDEAPPTGRVVVDGTVGGPFAGLEVIARIRSDALAWRGFTASRVDASIAADPDRIELTGVEARVAGGELAAEGRIEPATGRTGVTARFTELDLESLLRAFDVRAAPMPAGRISGSGRFEADGAGADRWNVDARARVEQVPRRPGRIGVPGTVALMVDERTWRLDASHSIEGVPVRAQLMGALAPERIEASTLGGTVLVDETSLATVLASLRLAGVLEGDPRVDSGRIRGEVSLDGTFARPRLRVVAAARDVAAAGVTNLAADIEAAGTPQQMAFTAGAQQGSANRVRADGTLFPDRGRFDAQISARMSELATLAGVPIEGTLALEAEAQGPFGAITASGTASVRDAAYERIRVGDLAATFAIDPAAARLEIVSTDLNARARGELALTPRRDATVDLVIDRASLERVLRDVDLPAPITGVVSLTARGAAPLDDWQTGSAVLEVTGIDAAVGDLPITGSARASFEDRIVTVERLDAEAEGVRLSVTGKLPIDTSAPVVPASDAVRASLVGDVGDVVAALRAARLTDPPVVSGRGQVAVLAHVSGTAMRPIVAADVDLSSGELTLPDLPPIRAVTIRAHVGDGWIEPLTLGAEWQGGRLEASGRIPMRLLDDYLPDAVTAALPPGGMATLRARASGITRAAVAPFVPPDALEQIDGALDVAADLQTTSLDAASLTGELRIERLDVRVAGLPITQRQPTRVVFENGLARVAAWDWTGQGATLGVQGQVRLADREAAILAAGRLDLRLLTPFVREAGVTLAGTLAPRVSVFGPIASPTIDGEVVLQGGEARLREPRVIATGLEAFAVLSPQRARLTSLSGTVNGGALTGGGEATYGTGAPMAARLTATIAGMGLELPEGLRSELNADLTLAVADAPAGASGSVTGAVTVVRSAYREPLAVVTGLLNTLRVQRVAAAAVPADSLAERLRLDVRVITDSDIVVDNNIARLQLGGDLRVIGTAAAPSLSGRAELREGGQLFLGRNVYTIETGTIDFADPVTIQPDLGVTAKTVAGGHEIELRITGPPDALEVDPRSMTDPSLGQPDVVSLLLVGRPLAEVSDAGAEIVGEQAIAYLSGDLLGIAGRTVGLDRIRLGGPDTALRRDPAAIATQTDPTSRLTFGKSIGSDVDLTYSQSLRNSAQTWVLDYRPWLPVNLRLVSDDETLRSYEFRHDVSVGGSPGAGRQRAPRAADRTVVDVVLEGDTAVPVERLRRAVRLSAGDTFDFSEWQQDRDRIEEFLQREGYLEARVGASRDDRADGVALTYEITAGPPTMVDVTGYRLSPDARRRIEQAWSQAIFDDFLEEESVAIVRDALAADGYLDPQVNADVSTGARKMLRITVDPGTRAAERRVAITAADDALARDLEAWVAASGLDAWREPDALRDAMAAELRARGHLRAQAAVAAPRMEGTTAILPVTVDAGPVYSVASVGFTGVSRLPIDRLREHADISAGAPFDPAEGDAARGRVEALYRREGFSAARVTIETAAAGDGAPAVALAFQVEEGPRQVLREVAVRGNRNIDPDVVTRALELEAGAPLPADAWLQARSRLFDTGLFRRVDVTTEAMSEEEAADERATRLVVTVEEWPALRLRYGFQLSERRPEDNVEGRELTPGLSADIVRRTLFGRAVGIGGAMEYQRRERLGRVFMNTPTLFGLRIESLLTGERSRRTFADSPFATDLTSVSWEQRLRVGGAVQLSYTYRFDRDHTFDTSPPNPLAPAFDLTVNVARLTAGAVFDTRDDPTDTSRGSLFSSTFEVAPESFGSQFRFVKELAQAYHFRRWKEIVFASAARFGTVSPLGGQELLPSERFLAGGARSVRGVAEDGLGPRSIFGDAEGGRTLVILNQEARFPVFKWVRGVTFLDTGNVFESPRDIDMGKLVTSWGLGVRFATPFGMLRADYARLWSDSPEVSPVRWTFGIGQTF